MLMVLENLMLRSRLRPTDQALQHAVEHTHTLFRKMEMKHNMQLVGSMDFDALLSNVHESAENVVILDGPNTCRCCKLEFHNWKGLNVRACPRCALD